MKVIHKIPAARQGRLVAAALCLITLSACSGLRPAATPQPAFYSLDSTRAGVPTVAPMAAPTLIINPPHAAAGFDSSRIIYVRENHKLEYFAHSEWVDPPARMLGPLLVAAVERTGAFRSVVLAPGAAAGDLRLDTEIIRLQHEFQSSPSRVRFTLRAYLVDDKTRRVLAWREFDSAVAATSEDPYGGVLAANLAVQAVLENLSQFLAERQK
ncbi:ABC-type transport auxiliary lipoprotein family protein [Rhodoferax sp. UBA5149]|uniref:ABC-type transport auxiliary lipoprotein family protein n=1 Tax=Rhodoferax sp. UBA5149 TaxID=1947379 RepID=UPI0025D0E3DE|nr:ABC-type transport auxiliary lipoprotein family protein [Rhodoferax sp. UBA5149]